MQKRRAAIVKGMTGGIAALFKAAGVSAIFGSGKLLAGRVVEVTGTDGKVSQLRARHVVLASGSVPTALKSLPFDGRQIIDSWGALELDAVPKRLCVIGAGVIGLELGSVWRRLGAEVVMLEALESSSADGRSAAGERGGQALQEAGPRHTPGRQGQRGAARQRGRDACAMRTPRASNRWWSTRSSSRSGAARTPTGLLAEGSGVKLDERGFISVDEHCAPAWRTSGRWAMWCAGRCWRTRARKRAWRSPIASPAGTLTSTTR